MKIRKAYKFRLKPTAEQAVQLHQFAGHCRFLWNKVLSMNLFRLEQKQPLLWYYEAEHWSKLWKGSAEYGFLKELPAHCLQQKLKDLDKAFRDGFDKAQPLKRIPKFKRRGMSDSFRFPEPKHIAIDQRRIKLPKLGWLHFYKSREIKGVIKNATVSRTAGRWYISVQVEQELGQPAHPATSSVGIDLGVNKFLACSNGSYQDPINAYKNKQAKLAQLQRGLSRKRKFSSNWKKQKTKIQQVHSTIANIRKDFQHKLSTTLSKNHAMIVVEALKITNMSKSAKGTLDDPGRQVSAKSGLNKAILDQGWGEFKRQLKYKLDWLGGYFVEVPAAGTSQRCSVCGYKDKGNRTTQAAFCCLSCGHAENADINAAKNILAAGHAVLACGEIGLPNSMKQELLGCGNAIPV